MRPLSGDSRWLSQFFFSNFRESSAGFDFRCPRNTPFSYSRARVRFWHAKYLLPDEQNNQFKIGCINADAASRGREAESIISLAEPCVTVDFEVCRGGSPFHVDGEDD